MWPKRSVAGLLTSHANPALPLFLLMLDSIVTSVMNTEVFVHQDVCVSSVELPRRCSLFRRQGVTSLMHFLSCKYQLKPPLTVGHVKRHHLRVWAIQKFCLCTDSHQQVPGAPCVRGVREELQPCGYLHSCHGGPPSGVQGFRNPRCARLNPMILKHVTQHNLARCASATCAEEPQGWYHASALGPFP